MNYREKYNDLLSRIKRMAYVQPDVTRVAIESLFPELKESEDEESKKWILEYLYDCLRKSDEQFKDHFKSAIAWLEKQGEQKIHTLEQAANIFLDALSNSPYNNKPITDAQTITKQLLIFLQDSASYNPDALDANEQTPAWSEEDEGMLNSFLHKLEVCNLLSNKENVWAVRKLKSLKDRYTWKPSDEQMHYLSWIANIKLGDSVVEQEVSKHLNELYKDLLKLKG